MRRRPLPTALLAALMLGLPVTSAAPTEAANATTPPTATVRLSGELLKTVAEPGQPAHAAVRTSGRLVPVDAADVRAVDRGSTVTLDLAVPAAVERAAARGTTLRVRDGRGALQSHPLDATDLADATDATPATAGSDVAAATIDVALSPGGPELGVERVVTASPAAAAAYTPATRRVTYVNVAPAGVAPAPTAPSALAGTITATDSFWRANSRGELGLSLAATPSGFTSAHGCSSPFALWDDAAQRVGWRWEPDKTLALRLPRAAEEQGCAWGLGTVGSSPNSPGYVYLIDDSVDTMAHEIGHNMSLQHADRLVCPSTSDAESSGGLWSDGCVQHGYADGQDIMSLDLIGVPSAMLSTPQALRTGMLEDSAATTVPGGSSMTVTLRPLAGRTGVRAARTTSSRTGVTYYVEYRTPTGLDRYNAWGSRTGVRVLRYDDPRDSTVLLDPSPTGEGSDVDDDPVLDPGETLTSHDGAVRVTTVSADATQAVVRIENDSPATLTRTADPVITGSARVAGTLRADPGAWTPTPDAHTYQWLRNGAPVPGATGTTYDLTLADYDTEISVEVTATRSGYAPARATSAPVRVGPAQLSVTTPTVSGTRAVGRTLTASAPSSSPVASKYSWQWNRNGRPISGARGRSYTVTTADAGRYLTVTVRASAPDQPPAERTSARVGIPMHAKTRPSVYGTTKVGRTLGARVGSWTPYPSSYAYQWYRGTTRITGATGRTYTLRSVDAGKRMTVRVTARRTGYVSGSASSTATTTIAR